MTTLPNRPGRQRSLGGIFPTADGGFIAMFNPEIRGIRAAFNPSVVCEDAGLDIHTFWRLKRQHGPDFIQSLYRSSRSGRPGRRRTEAGKPSWPAEVENLSFVKTFRDHATRRRSLKRCQRTNGELAALPAASRLPSPSGGAMEHWRRKYEKWDWFEGWLLRYDQDPASGYILTPDETTRCCAAFDYLSHLAAIGIRGDSRGGRWLLNWVPWELEWAKYAFGDEPPAGVFVADEPWQRLRAERSSKAICRASGVNHSIVFDWKSDPKTWSAVKAAIRAAERGLPWKAPPELDPRRKEAIRRYAKHATWSACRQRAGMRRKTFEDGLRLAKDLEKKGSPDLRKNLLRWLSWKGRAAKGTWRLAGLVAPGLYVPSQKFLEFRAVAKKSMDRNAIWEMFTRVRGFDRLFLACVTPRSTVIFPWMKNGQPAAPPAVERKKKKALTKRRARVLIWRHLKTTRSWGQVAIAWADLTGEKCPLRETIARSVGRLNLPDDANVTATAYALYGLKAPSQV